jgi:GDP-mannose 6-dehydrogenase
MKISIFGMGYVGCVSAACFANNGHQVIGVDINPSKVKALNDGKSPIIETDLQLLIERSVAQKQLFATTDCETAIQKTDISMICVGTPSKPNGSLDLTYVRRVCKNIGSALKAKDDFHVVVIRSTVLPGTVESTLIPILENESRKMANRDFGVCFNPEFLREGTAVQDFHHPPKTVIGASDKKTIEMVERIYEKLKAPLIQTSIRIAEMVKYADNAFHAVKICFANEIGNICKALDIDSHEVMGIFCQDTKLNLSLYYLKPGFAFGGSCLPKDVRALGYKAKELDLSVPLLSSLLISNEGQLKAGINRIIDTNMKRIGFLGFSFKAGTDDLRESPIVEMIETLLGKGYQIIIYDENVSLSRLIGANKEYLANHIPHISALMCDNIDEVISESEVIVIGNKAEKFKTVLQNISDSQRVIDLVRIIDDIPQNENYDGISW